MPLHPLTNFAIKNIMKMNLNLMVFIQKIIKDGANKINLDEY